MYFERWDLLAHRRKDNLLPFLQQKYNTLTKRHAKFAFRHPGMQETMYGLPTPYKHQPTAAISQTPRCPLDVYDLALRNRHIFGSIKIGTENYLKYFMRK